MAPQQQAGVHGEETSFPLAFVTCLETGNLSGDKLEVVIGLSTENVNRNLPAPVMTTQTQFPRLKHRTNCT